MQRQGGVYSDESERVLKRARREPILHYYDELKKVSIEEFEDRVALVKQHRELTVQEVQFVRRGIRLLKNRADSKMCRLRRIQTFNEMQFRIKQLEDELAALYKKQKTMPTVSIPESVVNEQPIIESISPTLIVSNVFLDMIEWF